MYVVFRRDTRPKVLWVTGTKKTKESVGDGEEETKEVTDGTLPAAVSQPRLAKELSFAGREDITDPAEVRTALLVLCGVF